MKHEWENTVFGTVWQQSSSITTYHMIWGVTFQTCNSDRKNTVQ